MNRWMYRKPARSSVSSNGHPEIPTVEIIEPKMFRNPDFIKKDFLNIVTILGSAKNGKSTLMNCIVGKDVFETSNHPDACTIGVWISDIVKSTEENGIVVYADTEGEGNANQENDTKLLTPVVFLSKVIILNIKGAMLPHRLLQKLHVFLYFGEHLNLAEDESFKLGHLIIVLRDYDLTVMATQMTSQHGTEEDERDRLLMKENRDDDADAIKRDKIREKVVAMFASITLFFFRESLTKMKPDVVRDRVKELKSIIDDKVSTSRMFGSSTCIDPGNVNEVAKKIVDQLNTPNGAFKMESLVEIMQCRDVDKAKNSCQTRFFEKIDPSKLILPVENIEDILTKEKENLIEDFMKDTSKEDSVSEYRDGVKEELETLFQQQLDFKKQENEPPFQQVSSAKTHFDNKLEQDVLKISFPDKREIIEKKLDKVINAGLKWFCENTRYVKHDSPYKKQALEKLVTSSKEIKRRRIEENDKHLNERETIEGEKKAFMDKLKDEIADINYPKTDFDMFMRQMQNKLLETFDKNTEDVEYEKGSKLNARTTLEKHCEKEISEAKKKNDESLDNRYLGWFAGGVGSAVTGYVARAGVTSVLCSGYIPVAAEAVAVVIGGGTIIGGISGYIASYYAWQGGKHLWRRLRPS